MLVVCLAGAKVQRLRPVSITNPDHFVNVARRRAAEEPNSIFADQFENLANFRAHLQTGQELWQQCEGHLDGFVCGAGTDNMKQRYVTSDASSKTATVTTAKQDSEVL